MPEVTSIEDGRKSARNRVRRREQLGRPICAVAFRGTEDVHRLDGNANRGKRHAARMAPMAENSGARRRNEPRIALKQTRNARTLPISKNVQKFEKITL